MTNHDQVIAQDYIYQQYHSKLAQIWRYVNQANLFLKQQEVDATITHGFFDCIDKSLLYGDKLPSRVLVACHKIKNPSLISAPYFSADHRVYGIHYMPPKDWHDEIDKDFNCFLNRLDPVRQDFFYQLFKQNLLNDGLISFNMTIRKELHPENKSSKDIFDDYHEKFLSSFDYLKPEIDKIVPFNNLQENFNLSTSMMRCKFGIVVETYFERSDAITFSEKTWRALQIPRPWLLFHATGSVQLLRDMGFYVYDDFVDHSYDRFETSDSYVERMDALLKEFHRLRKQPVSKSLLSHWKDQTLKNLEIMQGWSQSWSGVFDTINQARECALNLSR